MSYGELSNTQETMVLPMLQMKNIRGKPYITVSAKGMINGLSNIPNDGADFGPDTTEGATAPGQYGSPYTETCGIQDAVSYAYSNSLHKIHLSLGIFKISTAKLIGSEVASWVTGNDTDVVYFWGSILVPELNPDGSSFDLEIEGSGEALSFTAPTNQGTIIYVPNSTVGQVSIASGGTQTSTYYSVIVADTPIANTASDLSNKIHVKEFTVRFESNTQSHD